MEIKLSDHFTLAKLFRFVIPSIIMFLFTSLYGVVDGFFISNFIGDLEFSAVNFIIPFCMILGAVGQMIGAGGSALVAVKLGEQKNEEAIKTFSMLIKVLIVVGVILSIIGFIAVEDIALFLGASEAMLPYCVTYGKILILGLPFLMLQTSFQSFLVVAERPNLGLIVTVLAGVTNMILDGLLLAIFDMNVEGAALATLFSQVVGGIIPLVFFLNKNNGTTLKLINAPINLKDLFDTCFNGSSEFMTSISFSVISMVYNAKLMELAGEKGVAAYGVLMYVGFIYVSVFIGYAVGSAPIVSYNYGAENYEEMKNVYHKSLNINTIGGVVVSIVSFLTSSLFSQLYVGYDQELFEMTKNAFTIYSFSFVLTGICVYTTSFFTALENGVLSAILSILRTVVFQIAAVMILPIFFDLNGVWISLICSETLAAISCIIALILNKKRYNY